MVYVRDEVVSILKEIEEEHKGLGYMLGDHWENNYDYKATPKLKPISFKVSDGRYISIVVEDFVPVDSDEYPYLVFQLPEVSEKRWRLLGWHADPAGLQWDSFSEIQEVKEVITTTWAVV